MREICGDVATHGRMYINGIFECFTLEDVDRRLEEGGEKIHGETAIPLGTYAVILDESKRFGRIMPHVLNVPQFSGIRIHSGNTAQDTEGCLLLGTVRGKDSVLNSRVAYQGFFEKLKEALDNGESVSITYERA